MKLTKVLLCTMLSFLFVMQVSKGADTEVQDLTDITSPAAGDQMYIVDDPTGTPASRRIDVDDLLGVATDLEVGGALSADTVDSAELATGAVDLEHMSSASVDSDNIVDNTIANADMADNSIDSDDYVDGSIDTAHYASGSVDATAMGADSVGESELIEAMNFTGTGDWAVNDIIIEGALDLGTVETFTDSDTTPDVSTGSYWNTNTSGVTITDFDGAGIASGQIITVYSKGAIVFDIDAANLRAGSTDITTASGDITMWQYDGTDWVLIAFMDDSTDMGTDGDSGGDVVKVGTPANNEVAVWTGDGTIEGDTLLTFSGNELTVGAIEIKDISSVDIDGVGNVFVGFTVGDANTEGDWNTGIGYGAIKKNTTGSFNIGIGKGALASNTTGNANIAIGASSLTTTATGSSNTAIGVNSCFSLTTGTYNTSIGRDAGRWAGGGVTPNETSSNSVYIGDGSRASADGADNEIVIGQDAIGKGDDTVIIGAEGANVGVFLTGGLTVNEEGNDVDSRIEGLTETNLVYIDAGNDRVGIGTSTPDVKLDIEGAFTASGLITTGVGLDGDGAVDLDYGSADITDHTFTTDGTGTAEIVLPAGSIDGTEILDDTVALTTDTTGNYAAGDAEAGAALTGDTATAFFGAGTIEHERGGLEADVNAYDGLVGITGGATYNQTGTTTQIVIFDGAGAPTSAALSGDATMDNAGVVTVVDDSHSHVITNVTAFTKSALEGRTSDVSDYAEADGDTYSGVHDFGSATSMAVPHGANPTTDAIGKIGVDTTDDQFVYYGTAKRVISHTLPRGAIVFNLTEDDDGLSLGMFRDAVTITGIGVHCDGTCDTPAVIALSDRAGNAMTHVSPTVSTSTGNTTFTAVTANNSLVAGEGLEFSVTNTPSPETDTYTISYTYTWDAQ